MKQRSALAGFAVLLLASGTLTAFPASAGAQAVPPEPSRRPEVAVPEGQPAPARFILSFRPGTGPRSSDADAERIADGAAAKVGAHATVSRRMTSGAAVVRLSRALVAADASRFLDAVSSDPSISYVEPDLMMRATAVPNDPDWSQQWNYNETTGGIHLAEAHDVADGTGTVVAVIDTGRTLHPDLDANMLDGYDFISSASAARDGDGRDPDESDEGDWETTNQCGFPARNSSWHGTHVAGTIAAVTNNGIGVAGVAPGAKILPVRVLGLCGGATSDIADAIVWASGGTVAGIPANPTPADVINMSLGGTGTCGATSAFQVAINTAVGNGTTVVVSAGNSSTNASGFTPASCTNTITVASTNRSGARADYSNFGAVVDLAAPGGDTTPTVADGILSTLNTGTTVEGSPTYVFYQGTSMAAPHVSGVAALVLSQQSMTPAAVEALLKSTTRAFPGVCTQCGTGLLDAQAAVSGGGAGVTGTIGFALAKVKVNELATFVDVQLTVNRLDGTGTATVDWATGGGTATAGSDYTVASGTLTFAAGASSQTVTVRVLGDGLTETAESIRVTLSNATSGISLSPVRSTISIKANSV